MVLPTEKPIFTSYTNEYIFYYCVKDKIEANVTNPLEKNSEFQPQSNKRTNCIIHKQIITTLNTKQVFILGAARKSSTKWQWLHGDHMERRKFPFPFLVINSCLPQRTFTKVPFFRKSNPAHAKNQMTLSSLYLQHRQN